MDEPDVIPKVVEKKEEEEKPQEVITKKDPKRVEQGKRLAAISKEAKERKMRERIREEDFSYLPWLGYGFSILSSLGILYYIVFSKKEEEIHPMTIIRETPPDPILKKKFESLK